MNSDHFERMSTIHLPYIFVVEKAKKILRTTRIERVLPSGNQEFHVGPAPKGKSQLESDAITTRPYPRVWIEMIGLKLVSVSDIPHDENRQPEMWLSAL